VEECQKSPPCQISIDKVAWISQALLQQLKRQLEWYFSDANLATDHALYRRISEALPEGWLSCTWLTRCRRLQELGATPLLILGALKASHLETKVDYLPGEVPIGPCSDLERRLFVRRRQPLPPLLRRECRGLNGEVPQDFEEAVVQDPHKTINRLKDQQRVQEQLGLCEVGDPQTVFRERPRPVEASSEQNEEAGPIIAVGYERVLYGDGGAYVELNADQVQWEAWCHYFNKSIYNSSYYDEYYTPVSHAAWLANWERWDPNPSSGVLMLYAQKFAVDDRPWAPGAASSRHAWRPGGYADYRPGYFYFAADGVLVTADRALPKPERAASNRALPPIPSTVSLGGRTPKSEESSSDDGWGVCWNFQQGCCRRGGACKWRHSSQV